MKPLLATVVGLVLLIGVGVAVYPAAHGSYVRHRGTVHVREAEALRDQMTSPVAKAALAGASDELKFALMRSDVPVEDVARFDRELVRLMASLKASPPPDNPLEVTVAADPGVQAGDTTTVRVTVHSLLPRAFLVNVTVQVSLDAGWKSSPARKAYNQAIEGTPIETTLAIQIPPDVAGIAHVRATATYRLDPTGEGMDLHAQSAAPAALTIARGR